MTLNPLRLLNRLICYIYYKLGDKTMIALYKIYKKTKNNEMHWHYHPKCKDTLVCLHKSMEFHINKGNWCYLRIHDYTDKNDTLITSLDSFLDGEIVERIYEKAMEYIIVNNIEKPKTKREILINNILEW